MMKVICAEWKRELSSVVMFISEAKGLEVPSHWFGPDIFLTPVWFLCGDTPPIPNIVYKQLQLQILWIKKLTGMNQLISHTNFNEQ